jgi:hypothetical protein
MVPAVKKKQAGAGGSTATSRQPAEALVLPMQLSSAVAPPLLYPGGVRAMLDSGPCHVAGKRVTEYMELYRADLRGDIRTAVER